MPITYAQIQNLSVEEKQITIHVEKSEHCPNHKTLTVAYVFRIQGKPLVNDQREIGESGDIKINLPDFPDSGNVSLLLDRLNIDKWDWRPLREETPQVKGMPKKQKKMGRKDKDLWDQFEKIEELGKGGQGVVYKAKDKSSGKAIAIKRIKIQNPQKLLRARREIEALKRIDHENVIKILFFKEDPPSNPSYMWIGLEFANYGNLSNNDAMRSEPPLALKIFKQICKGVKAVHKEGIIHRDLKPENILFIDSLRIPKISDFGICFLRDLAEDTRITRTTETVGPKDFTAPELEGWKPDVEDISPPADIYSLGKIFYYMLEGRIVKREKFEPIGQKYRIPELDTVLQKTICEYPDKRFQTVGELEGEIEKILSKYPPYSK
jgi:serine/threonine protein kinase